jgi:hypothetical protein
MRTTILILAVLSLSPLVLTGQAHLASSNGTTLSTLLSGDQPPQSRSTSAPGCAEPGFGPVVNIFTGGRPSFLAVGDFNRDGKPDLVVPTTEKLLIFLGQGDGSFVPHTVPLPPSLHLHPDFVAVGDFNNDGRQDLALTNIDPDKGINLGVFILLGNGDGTFGTPKPVALSAGAGSITVGDFDGDGNQDLVLTFFSGLEMQVFHGDGLGQFVGPIRTIETKCAGANGVVVGDFNHDGKQDLAVTFYPTQVTRDPKDRNRGFIDVFYGDGKGNFTEVSHLPAGIPYAPAVGDFNRDGKQDLAVGNFSGDDVKIWLADSKGRFNDTPSTFSVTSLSNPLCVAVGDFNNDGKLDLVMSDQGLGNAGNSGSVGVLMGDGAGGFTPGANIPVGGPLPHGESSARNRTVVVADFNRDGRMDLATANWGTQNISILLNRTCGCF